MALRLGPKPSLFVICFFFSVFVFCFVCFFGGFKGQVRWPKAPPHLALNPPHLLIFVFVFVFFFCSFAFFVFNRKTLFSPLKRHFLLIFCVSLSFSLNLFWPPPFSVSLSLSLSLLLLSFFLPSCLSFLLYFSCFCLFFILLSSLLLFLIRTTWKFKLQFICFINRFSFLWLPVLLFLSNPFSLSLFFLILSYVFCSTWMVFGFKTNNLKTRFLVTRGVATKRLFYKPVFCKMWKSYRLVGVTIWAKLTAT